MPSRRAAATLRELPAEAHHSTRLMPRSVKAQSMSTREARFTRPCPSPARSSQQPISHTPVALSNRGNMTPPTRVSSSQIPKIPPLSAARRSA